MPLDISGSVEEAVVSSDSSDSAEERPPLPKPKAKPPKRAKLQIIEVCLSVNRLCSTRLLFCRRDSEISSCYVTSSVSTSRLRKRTYQRSTSTPPRPRRQRSDLPVPGSRSAWSALTRSQGGAGASFYIGKTGLVFGQTPAKNLLYAFVRFPET